jgi:hypothetical protein
VTSEKRRLRGWPPHDEAGLAWKPESTAGTARYFAPISTGGQLSNKALRQSDSHLGLRGCAFCGLLLSSFRKIRWFDTQPKVVILVNFN